ncbi:hypothetical protein [Actinokineospora globicatena]|uniref:DUF7919 family protein n=1 Tax=Actinokineospora globicatena TaxID=103729 RepID=UPI0020A4EE50|nr:hypothetical protein [Actinokineospora globicatena]MCP2304249.1 hypothetical protein [Actinokineospora globicatena]GLW78390.1 hypothetical protein Aglo01_28720 [Actinokineospora globicatena]GLW84946.1 hypothetical protein Aglo02_25860 [Actinokineospora globicatena]
MAVYPDLSPYEYTTSDRLGGGAPAGTVNVGWIGVEQPYTRRPANAELVHALLRLSLTHDVRQMGGYHRCPFCEHTGHFVVPFAESPVDMCYLGSAEIQIEGSDGTIYAAPTLIAHYVADHEYRPPADFVRAALAAAAEVGPWAALAPPGHPDLSIGTDYDGQQFLRVGWLIPDRDFPTGPITDDLLPTLRLLRETHETRLSPGSYACPICHHRTERDGPHGSGMADLTIPNPNGTPFRAPRMIIHFV